MLTQQAVEIRSCTKLDASFKTSCSPKEALGKCLKLEMLSLLTPGVQHRVQGTLCQEEGQISEHEAISKITALEIGDCLIPAILVWCHFWHLSEDSPGWGSTHTQSASERLIFHISRKLWAKLFGRKVRAGKWDVECWISGDGAGKNCKNDCGAGRKTALQWET